MSTIKQALNQTNGAGKVRRDIVRFGDGERDFFHAEGTDEDFAVLTAVWAKDFTQQPNKLHAREAVLAAQKQEGW